MRDVLAQLTALWHRGRAAGLATVIDTWQSAPRQAGATMLVTDDGAVAGSVSGGCVEGAVYELCQEAIRDGRARAQRYGVSDGDAFEVGLTCGGVIDLFIERIDQSTFPQLGEVAAAIEAGTPVAVATCVEGTGDRFGRRLIVWPDQRDGTLGSTRIDDAVADDARGLLAGGLTKTLRYGHDGERRGDDLACFVASYAPRPRLLVFGAIDFAAAVARVGAFLGYRVTVCDARPIFATPHRFPEADEVVVDWPHRYLSDQIARGAVDERTVVCVLTHDPKFDVPLLELALRQPFAYVGAMGSRRTHEDRMRRLREAGLSEQSLGRLAAPIGLDLGARTPEETAISIAAEIVASRWGGSGGRLADLPGRIHH